MGSSRRRTHKRHKKTAEPKGPQPFFIGEEITLTIDRLSFNGGRGVGRYEGFVVFCQDVAPNEVVRVRITQIKKSFAEAELLEIVDKSVDRRDPPCPIAHQCGGCSWQHVEYSAQVREKQEILRHSLRKLMAVQEFEFRPFSPAPNEFRYRNRIQVHKSSSQLGFFSRKSNDIIDTEDCLIAEKELTEPFSKLRSDSRYQPHKGRPLRLEIARTADQGLQIYAGKRPPTAALFSQVNTQQNRALIQLLLETTQPLRPQRIFDLYCGAGNFTFPLAEQWPEAPVFAADLSQNSIERAQKQARDQSRPSPLEFVAADVGEFLKNYEASEATFLLLDPPRAGCSNQVIEELLRLKPTHMVYISCNPMTLARDLEKLTSQGAYKIDLVQGLDMFPQTEHMETFVLLSQA